MPKAPRAPVRQKLFGKKGPFTFSQLSPLPPNVLLLVADLVPRSTLLAMMHINSVFNSVATRLLYRNLSIGGSRWPKLHYVPRRLPGPFGKVITTKSGASGRVTTPNLKKILTVDVRAHSLSVCGSDVVIYGPLGPSPNEIPPLPRLQTLRLWLTNTDNPRHFHILGDPDEPSLGTLREVPCIGLAKLRPSTLVLRNVPLLHSCFPRAIVTDEVALAAERVVIVFSPAFERRDDGTQPIINCALDSMPTTFIHCPVTLVFQTPNPHTKWRPNPVPPNRLGNNLSDGMASLYAPADEPADPPHEFDLAVKPIFWLNASRRVHNSIAFVSKSWLAEVFGWIAGVLHKFPRVDFTLVNAASLDPLDGKVAEQTWPEDEGFEGILPWMIQHYLTACVMRDGSDPEEVQARMERVHFVNMPDFLAENGQTVFPDNEMAGWLDS